MRVFCSNKTNYFTVVCPVDTLPDISDSVRVAFNVCIIVGETTFESKVAFADGMSKLKES